LCYKDLAIMSLYSLSPFTKGLPKYWTSENTQFVLVNACTVYLEFIVAIYDANV